MNDETSKDRAQLHVDLWMHQNNLLWGRYATLLQLQAAIFAGTYAIHFGATPRTAITALLATAIGAAGFLLTILIWNAIQADMVIRDGHARRLADGHDLDPSRPINKLLVYAPAPSELIMHRSVIWSFIAVDVVIALLALFQAGQLWKCLP